MKKLLIILGMALLFASCQKEVCGVIKDKDIRADGFYLKVDRRWINVTYGTFATYEVGTYQCFE